MKRRVEDVLQKKQHELNNYMKMFDDACSIVTNTISTLCQLNSDIETKIQEIDDYREELSKTRNGLDKAHQRNEKVIKNFNTLLGEE